MTVGVPGKRDSPRASPSSSRATISDAGGIDGLRGGGAPEDAAI